MLTHDEEMNDHLSAKELQVFDALHAHGQLDSRQLQELLRHTAEIEELRIRAHALVDSIQPGEVYAKQLNYTTILVGKAKEAEELRKKAHTKEELLNRWKRTVARKNVDRLDTTNAQGLLHQYESLMHATQLAHQQLPWYHRYSIFFCLSGLIVCSSIAAPIFFFCALADIQKKGRG